MADAVHGPGEGEKKRKKRKKMVVEMEAFKETADRVAPVVGYFPSGYDPSRSSSGAPGVAVYRHKERPNRLELIVSPPDSGVQFVGKSYAGEAAGAQLCNYAIGVFDKEKQTLKIVPIASNKILRLEPKLVKRADPEHSEALTEGSVVKGGRVIADLTSLYGAKKDRDRDNKWKSLHQQRNDPSINELLEFKDSDSDEENVVFEDSGEVTTRNIPPYDLSADTPDKAYLLDEIIPKNERVDLLDIMENLDSGDEISSLVYPTFVLNRTQKLKNIQNKEEQEKVAFIFSYITHLHHFWQRTSKSRHFKSKSRDKSEDNHKIPRLIYQRLLKTFLDPESNVLSAQKNELLIGYILVLTLFADDFRTDPTDISKDLKMTVNSLKPYYQQLGCKSVRESPSDPLFMILPVPLKFSELRRNRRRGR